MPENLWIILVVFPLAGYLIGSIPFGFLIARAKGVDLRSAGSGNVGATNVGRVLGRKWGYLCFLLDVLKGFAPTMAVSMMLPDGSVPTLVQQLSWIAVGLGTVLGHVFTFWLKFRGGKGVATALGITLGVYPYFTLPGLIAFGIWIAVTLISRYVSLGSVVAAVSFLPVFCLFYWADACQLLPLMFFAGTVMSLILIRHRTNMQRLLAGTENKIGRKKE